MASTAYYTRFAGKDEDSGRRIARLECWGAGGDNEYWRAASPWRQLNLTQIRLEPILRAGAERLSPGRIRFNHELLELDQDDGGVTATVRDNGTGETYRVQKFEHVSIKARGLGGTERFIERGLGLGFSDRMGRTASWWHCDAARHGMAVVLGPRHELSHYAWTAPDLNAIGRICDRLAARGRKLIWGPSRHGPGNNLFVYFHDPAGAMIEVCAEMARMPPDGEYVARQWPGGLGSINQWGGPPPPRFLLTGFPIAPRDGKGPRTR
jgi:catechol 2,3-dioxygenase-like lactoylglutathione lyase family enzyme